MLKSLLRLLPTLALVAPPCLPFGCESDETGDDDDDDDDDGTGGGTPLGGIPTSTGTATTSATASTSATTTATATSLTSTSSMVADTGNEGGAEDFTAGDESGGRPTELCAELGAKYEMCSGESAADATADCDYYWAVLVALASEACFEANVTYVECLLDASCTELENETACLDAEAAVDPACADG